ncbi:MAG TPA: hypothetical protein VGI39_40315 [Polyangiaceae bacterium]
MGRVLMVAGAFSLAALAACSGDDSGATSPPGDDSGSTSNPDAGSTTTDSGSGGDSTTANPDSGQKTDSGTQADTGTTQSDTGTGSETGNGTDSGDDGGSTADAADAADSATMSFCQTQAGFDFCNDFDLPDPLNSDPDGGANAWSAIVGSTAEVATSTVQAKSQPNSALVSLPLGSVNGDRSAKVVKMLTPVAGVAQAIYEFDLYIDHVPAAGAGGFATDFQFSDTNAGSDRFGFRIGLFSKADGTFDHADVEHNHPDLGGNDDIVSPINITAGAWNHVKMVVAYGTDADGGDQVAFQLFLNGGTTADVNATYPAPFAKAPFARFAAGMVFAFDGTNKDWGLYYDNFTLKLQ